MVQLRILKRGILITFCFTLFNAGCKNKSISVNQNPPALGYHSMAYDTESKRVVLYGGITGDFRENKQNICNTTWTYDPAQNTWTRMNQDTQPPALASHCMAYDKESDQVVLYGGIKLKKDGSIEKSAETWGYNYNKNKWTRMSDGPPATSAHMMAYHIKADRIILFGGSQPSSDTWTYNFNTDTWKQMNPPVKPKQRVHGGLCYDQSINKVVMWGGWKEGVQDNSIWNYDIEADQWEEKTGLNTPRLLDHFAMTIDNNYNIVIYGGSFQEKFNGSNIILLYNSERNEWSKIESNINPGKLSRLSMVNITDKNKILSFGGQLDTCQFRYSNQTWLLDIKNYSWSNITKK